MGRKYTGQHARSKILRLQLYPTKATQHSQQTVLQSQPRERRIHDDFEIRHRNEKDA